MQDILCDYKKMLDGNYVYLCDIIKQKKINLATIKKEQLATRSEMRGLFSWFYNEQVIIIIIIIIIWFLITRFRTQYELQCVYNINFI